MSITPRVARALPDVALDTVKITTLLPSRYAEFLWSAGGSVELGAIRLREPDHAGIMNLRT
jgi:hypothetical protein